MKINKNTNKLLTYFLDTVQFIKFFFEIKILVKILNQFFDTIKKSSKFHEMVQKNKRIYIIKVNIAFFCFDFLNNHI